MKWSYLSIAHYGTGELGINALEVFVRVHLILFATEALGLTAQISGLILAASTITDALLDPLIGKLSDWEKIKYNSRLRVLGIGLLLLVTSLMGFIVSGEFTELIRYIVFAVSTLAFNCSLSFLFVPYSALPIDWSEDRKLRGELVASRLIGGNLGAFIGLGVPAYFLSQSQVKPDVYSNSWLALLGFFIICGIVFSVLVLKKPLPQKKLGHSIQSSPPVSLIKIFTQKNPIFLNLLAMAFFLNIALTLNSSLAIPYYRTFLKLQESDVQKILLGFLLVFTFSIPIWVYLGNKFGRKKALVTGGSILAFSQFFIYLLLPQENFLMALFWAAFIGGIPVGCAVLLEALLTDFNEYLKIKKSENQLGVYLGIWKMASKISRGLALALTGFILSWIGFDQGPLAESAEAGLKLAWFFGPGVGVFLLISVLVGSFNGLTEKNILRIRKLSSKM